MTINTTTIIVLAIAGAIILIFGFKLGVILFRAVTAVAIIAAALFLLHVVAHLPLPTLSSH